MNCINTYEMHVKRIYLKQFTEKSRKIVSMHAVCIQMRQQPKIVVFSTILFHSFINTNSSWKRSFNAELRATMHDLIEILS